MSIVNQSKLQFYLELRAIKITNIFGLELNKAVEHEHLKTPLQFICGMGPRKANFLINKIIILKNVKTRASLLELQILGQKVFNNCAGFIKIKKSKNCNNYDFDTLCDFLDSTRIHPIKYNMAKKIARSAMEESFNKSNEIATRIILNQPEKLNCLDLNEYIRKSLEKGVLTIEHDISFILEEFKNPFFVNIIIPHVDLNPSELFGLLIGDPNFRIGSYALAKIIKSERNHIKCKLQNDLDGYIWVKDIYDDENITDQKIEEIHENFRQISFIETRVKDINLHLFRVDLTAKPSSLQNIKNFIEVEKLDKYFKIIEDDWILSQFSENNLKKKNQNNPKGLSSRYQARNIRNSNFKNIDYSRTIDFLRNAELGSFIFRPSSRGNNFLNLSWKFYENCYSHLEIEEMEKPAGASIGSKLRMEKEIYYSLQEISEKFVKNCEIIVRNAKAHRKFIHFESIEEMERRLKEEKMKDKSFINYNFTILNHYPQYIILGYCVKIGTFTTEFIKVRENGLSFHNELFGNLEELSHYFKKHFSTEAYRNFVRNTLRPVLREDINYNNMLNNSDFDLKNFDMRSMQMDSLDGMTSFNNQNSLDFNEDCSSNNHFSSLNQGFNSKSSSQFLKNKRERSFDENNNWENSNFNGNINMNSYSADHQIMNCNPDYIKQDYSNNSLYNENLNNNWGNKHNDNYVNQNFNEKFEYKVENNNNNFSSNNWDNSGINNKSISNNNNFNEGDFNTDSGWGSSTNNNENTFDNGNSNFNNRSSNGFNNKEYNGNYNRGRGGNRGGEGRGGYRGGPRGNNSSRNNNNYFKKPDNVNRQYENKSYSNNNTWNNDNENVNDSNNKNNNSSWDSFADETQSSSNNLKKENESSGWNFNKDSETNFNNSEEKGFGKTEYNSNWNNDPDKENKKNIKVDSNNSVWGNSDNNLNESNNSKSDWVN